MTWCLGTSTRLELGASFCTRTSEKEWYLLVREQHSFPDAAPYTVLRSFAIVELFDGPTFNSRHNTPNNKIY